MAKQREEEFAALPSSPADTRQAECVCGCWIELQLTGARNGDLLFATVCENCRRNMALEISAVPNPTP